MWRLRVERIPERYTRNHGMHPTVPNRRAMHGSVGIHQAARAAWEGSPRVNHVRTWCALLTRSVAPVVSRDALQTDQRGTRHLHRVACAWEGILLCRANNRQGRMVSNTAQLVLAGSSERGACDWVAGAEQELQPGPLLTRHETTRVYLLCSRLPVRLLAPPPGCRCCSALLLVHSCPRPRPVYICRIPRAAFAACTVPSPALLRQSEPQADWSVTSRHKSSPRYARARTNFSAGIFARALHAGPCSSSAALLQLLVCHLLKQPAVARPALEDPVCCLLLSRDLGARYSASGCLLKSSSSRHSKVRLLCSLNARSTIHPRRPRPLLHPYCSCRPCSHTLPMICKLASCSFPLVHRQTQSRDFA
jgi:hypothetical protein